MKDMVKFFCIVLFILGVIGFAQGYGERKWHSELALQATGGVHYDHMGNAEYSNADGDAFVATE